MKKFNILKPSLPASRYITFPLNNKDLFFTRPHSGFMLPKKLRGSLHCANNREMPLFLFRDSPVSFFVPCQFPIFVIIWKICCHHCSTVFQICCRSDLEVLSCI